MACGLRHGCGVHILTRLLYGFEDILKPLAGEEPVLETYLSCLLEDILRIASLQSQHHVAGLVVVLRRA